MKKYVPQEYQTEALNKAKGEIAALEAKLKAAKLEAREAKEAKEKEAEEDKKDAEKKDGTAGTTVTELAADYSDAYYKKYSKDRSNYSSYYQKDASSDKNDAG